MKMSQEQEAAERDVGACGAESLEHESGSGGGSSVSGAEERPLFMELGGTERRLIASLMGAMPRLAYKTHSMTMDNNKVVEVYDIPDEDRQKVLDELYVFEPRVQLDDIMFDLHEGKTFCVRDFMVVREDDGNFLVSPYYRHSGGTMLDWLSPDVMEEEHSKIKYVQTLRPEYWTESES